MATFTTNGGYDQDNVYAGVAERHPDASGVAPPRTAAVPSAIAETALTQRGRHTARHDASRVVVGGKGSAACRRNDSARRPLRPVSPAQRPLGERCRCCTHHRRRWLRLCYRAKPARCTPLRQNRRRLVSRGAGEQTYSRGMRNPRAPRVLGGFGPALLADYRHQLQEEQPASRIPEQALQKINTDCVSKPTSRSPPADHRRRPRLVSPVGSICAPWPVCPARARRLTRPRVGPGMGAALEAAGVCRIGRHEPHRRCTAPKLGTPCSPAHSSRSAVVGAWPQRWHCNRIRRKARVCAALPRLRAARRRG
jgi:hypothetical protein